MLQFSVSPTRNSQQSLGEIRVALPNSEIQKINICVMIPGTEFLSGQFLRPCFDELFKRVENPLGIQRDLGNQFGEDRAQANRQIKDLFVDLKKNDVFFKTTINLSWH